MRRALPQPSSLQLAQWGLLLAGGFCYAMANVGWGLWPLAFICLVPLWRGLVLARGRHLSSVFFLGACYGGIVYAAGFGWLFALVGHFIDSVVGASLLWLACGIWFALGFGVYALCSQWLIRRGCPGWVSFTAPMLLLEAGQIALFPCYLGAGLLYQAHLSQLASLGGPLLLSALALVCNWQVFRAANNFNSRYWLLALGRGGLALLLAVCYGHLRLAGEEAGADAVPVRVGVVQNNVVRANNDGPHGQAAFDRASYRRNLALSRLILEDGPVDLLVWPESSYSRALRRPLPLDAQMIRRDISVPLLFGGTSSFHHRGKASSANSLFLSDGEGRVEQAYDKQILLPFAETVPEPALLEYVQEQLPVDWAVRWRDRYEAWIGKLFPWHQNFVPGPGKTVLSLDGLRIATPICFELIHPDYVRRLVQGGAANMIVAVANDAWFGHSQEPWMHLALARMRAIEHGLWVVRGTNSGISAIIDPRGRVVEQSRLFEEAAFSSTVYPKPALTPYSRYGNWVAYLGALILLVTMSFCSAYNSPLSRASSTHC